MVPEICSSVLVPHPGGYFLDVWTGGVDTDRGGYLNRYKFQNVSQVTDFSTEARRVALLAAGFEEHTFDAQFVQIDDLFPSIEGGIVTSIDDEKKYKTIVAESDFDQMEVVLKHFSFYGTEGTLSLPPDSVVTIVRRIQ